MGKMYTLDDELLGGSPEIRIGDKVFSIDDRQKTVRKAMKLFDKSKTDSETEQQNTDDFERIEELFKLAFGKNYKEIESMELSFSACNKITEIIISAMTGAEVEKNKDNFHNSDGDVV
jgi:hypothetical protein